MKLNAKNLDRMNADQKKRYRKHLVQVRSYAKDNREWKKLIKLGKTRQDFKSFRRAKYGELEAAVSNRKVENIKKEISEVSGSSDEIAMLRRLIASLESAEKIKAEARQELFKLMGIK